MTDAPRMLDLAPLGVSPLALVRPFAGLLALAAWVALDGVGVALPTWTPVLAAAIACGALLARDVAPLRLERRSMLLLLVAGAVGVAALASAGPALAEAWRHGVARWAAAAACALLAGGVVRDARRVLLLVATPAALVGCAAAWRAAVGLLDPGAGASLDANGSAAAVAAAGALPFLVAVGSTRRVHAALRGSLLALAAACAVAVVVARDAAGAAALASGVVAWLWLRRREKGLAAGLAVVAVVVLVAVPPGAWRAVVSAAAWRAAARSWRGACDLVAAHPLFGDGPALALEAPALARLLAGCGVVTCGLVAALVVVTLERLVRVRAAAPESDTGRVAEAACVACATVVGGACVAPLVAPLGLALAIGLAAALPPAERPESARAA